MGCGPSTAVGPDVVYQRRWRVVQKLGSGSFGHVVQAEDLETGKRVALKYEQLDEKTALLHHEATVLQALQPAKFVPRLLWYGVERNCRIMVSELLGPSLEDLLDLCNPGLPKEERSLSMPTVLVIGIRAVQALRMIHQLGYVHRDIKPENLLMGHDLGPNDLYLIDFGLAVPYSLNVDPQTQRHRHLVGTPNYASVRSHDGLVSLPRDDLESIGYVLLYLHSGRLPWTTLRKKLQQGVKVQTVLDKIRAMKAGPVEDLCQMSPHLQPFLSRLRTLPATNLPDYDELAALLAKPLHQLTGRAPEAALCDWQTLPGTSDTETVYRLMQRRSARPDFSAADEAELRRESMRMRRLEDARTTAAAVAAAASAAAESGRPADRS